EGCRPERPRGRGLFPGAEPAGRPLRRRKGAVPKQTETAHGAEGSTGLRRLIAGQSRGGCNAAASQFGNRLRSGQGERRPQRPDYHRRVLGFSMPFLPEVRTYFEESPRQI